MLRVVLSMVGVLVTLVPSQGTSQTVTDLAALRGLSPVAALSNTPQGRAALAANYTVTGGLQSGAIRQSTLLPFAVQQQQALQDTTSTGGNLEQLADGLGSTLGSAYVARAHYIDAIQFTSVSPAVAELIRYALATSGGNSNSGKFFFANLTTDGTHPVSADALALFKSAGGHPDIFGQSYGRPAGSADAGPFGNARPFQTEPAFTLIAGPDFFNMPSSNALYNHGTLTNLTSNPSYPSGHTNYGYTGALVLALLVPERYQQMVTRGAEYGNDRILIGAHYAMDVLGGRTLALYDMAHLLANDPAYVGHTAECVTIKDFQAALQTARAQVRSALQASCGDSIERCARADHGRMSDAAADEAFYSSTQTYGLPPVHAATASSVEDVGKLAPEAGYLLTTAFPSLTMDEANRILTETEGPGGGFLDNGSSFGVYSRLNLYAAGGRATALAAGKR